MLDCDSLQTSDVTEILLGCKSMRLGWDLKWHREPVSPSAPEYNNKLLRHTFAQWRSSWFKAKHCTCVIINTDFSYHLLKVLLNSCVYVEENDKNGGNTLALWSSEIEDVCQEWCGRHGGFFLLPARSAAALTKYILLHAVCIQLGHTTLSKHCSLNFDPLALIHLLRIVGQNRRKSVLADWSRTSWYIYFWHSAFRILCIGTLNLFSGVLNSPIVCTLERTTCFRDACIEEEPLGGVGAPRWLWNVLHRALVSFSNVTSSSTGWHQARCPTPLKKTLILAVVALVLWSVLSSLLYIWIAVCPLTLTPPPPPHKQAYGNWGLQNRFQIVVEVVEQSYEPQHVCRAASLLLVHYAWTGSRSFSSVPKLFLSLGVSVLSVSGAGFHQCLLSGIAALSRLEALRLN